jgi:hypothetical protein
MALLDVYKTKQTVTVEIKLPDESTVEEDEQRTVASDITESSELNEPIDDLVNLDRRKHTYSVFEIEPLDTDVTHS